MALARTLDFPVGRSAPAPTLDGSVIGISPAPIPRRDRTIEAWLIERLSQRLEVDVETLDPFTDLPHTSLAWLVVVDRSLYVRARRGRNRPWFRDAQVTGCLAIWIDGERIPFFVRDEADPVRLHEVTHAYVDKYGYDRSVRRMLRRIAVEATFELLPAVA